MNKKIMGSLLVGALLLQGGTTALAGEVKEGENTYHIVESGDTLSTIGERYNSHYTVIHGNNADTIANANLIHVGQKILVGGPNFNSESTSQPVQEVAVEQPTVATVVEQPVATEYVAPQSSSAKEWIAMKESGGSYDARNNRYIGRYQLDSSYLNGDFSPANQERVVEQYVSQRYGSWENAQSFWLQNGWY